MDGFVVVLDGPLVLAQVGVGEAPVHVGYGQLGIKSDSLVEIPNGPLVLAQVVVCEAPIDVGNG